MTLLHQHGRFGHGELCCINMADRSELCCINMAVIQVADAIANANLTAEEKIA